MNLTVKHWNTTEIFNLLKFYEILVIPTEILNLAYMNVSGKKVDFEDWGKHIMEKNGFEVPGGGGVSGDGDWMGWGGGG